MLVDFAPILRAFTRERDVIVLDQRGTGRSAALKCPSLTDEPEIYTPEHIVSATRECLEQLEYDPRYFTTTVAVDDLDALRRALGYEQLSIYGVSYGTRVAMQFMRAYPESTRSAVIDGVIPPTINLGADVAINSQITLDKVFARCAQEPACAERFSNLREDFQRLSDRLREQPIPMQLQHPVTGVLTNLELTYGHLAVWVRLALYAPETTALIPLIIDQAANQANYLPVAASALRMVHQLTTSLTYGMHNAVVCTEDAPFYQGDDFDPAALEQSYLGPDMYDTLKTMCSIWPPGIIDEQLKAPLASDIPTLVLSGEFDPVTPPRYGAAVMPGLSQGIHIVAPGQGHGTIARGCIPTLVLEFVESADATSVDASCTERLRSYPFFNDLMGPSP
jgi:pimeloyl-ACP methyl ester carboxylesterase